MTDEELRAARLIIAEEEQYGHRCERRCCSMGALEVHLNEMSDDFFMAAREGWPKALDEIEKLRQENERLVKLIREHGHFDPNED